MVRGIPRMPDPGDSRSDGVRRFAAQGEDAVVHGFAVGAGNRGCRDIGGEGRQQQHPPFRKGPAVFLRGIVVRRQAVGDDFDPPRRRLRAQPPFQLAFGGRNEAAHGHHAAPCALHGLGQCRFLRLRRQFPRQPHREAERRRQQGGVAHRAPGHRRVQRGVADAGHDPEAVRVRLFPQRSRGVSPDVAPDGGELPRRKRQCQPERALPRDGGRPRAPRFAPGFPAEPMRERQRVERRIAVEIHHEQEMHVVGHDHPVGHHESRVFAVERQQPAQHRLSRRQQFRMGEGVAAAVKGRGGLCPPSLARLPRRQVRQHLRPPIHAKREEKELPSLSGKAQSHAAPFTAGRCGRTRRRRRLRRRDGVKARNPAARAQ